ncbi:MAG TPA: BMP family ABC transporter substrate-binding protein [Proteobacteria bacterium]|nr:BMP family ABC transporter substrate-binding protein [Pseudomonadota bacterium]
MKLKSLVVALITLALVTSGFISRAEAKPFRVAVILPSAINDTEWSQSLYEAFLSIQNEMGKENFQFVYSENMWSVSDATAAIRDYASEGYDLVIGHGGQYGTCLIEVAPSFPKLSFAWGTINDTLTDQGIKNVFAYDARAEQGGYVNGVIAARLSRSKILGMVNPMEISDCKAYVDGFTAGAKSIDPKIKVKPVWTGSYSDVALASETAQALIKDGADVLSGTSQMCVGAIGVARDKGVLWFGARVDPSRLAPDNVICSMVYDWTVAFKPMIKAIQGGTRGGKIFELTLANKGITMVLNQQAVDRVLVGNTVSAIIDGKIKVE